MFLCEFDTKGGVKKGWRFKSTASFTFSCKNIGGAIKIIRAKKCWQEANLSFSLGFGVSSFHFNNLGQKQILENIVVNKQFGIIFEKTPDK